MALTENNLRTLALNLIEEWGTKVNGSSDFEELAEDMCVEMFGLGYELDEDDRTCLWDLIDKSTVTLPAYLDPRV